MGLRAVKKLVKLLFLAYSICDGLYSDPLKSRLKSFITIFTKTYLFERERNKNKSKDFTFL